MTIGVAVRDMRGLRFGKLQVMEFYGRDKFYRQMWMCHCDCGRDKIIALRSLLTGRTRSCGDKSHRKGCSHHGRKCLDLTGKRFGKLIVIRRVGVNSRGSPAWECLCDCGNTKIITGGCLSSGDTQSCGCLQYLSRWKHGMSRTVEYNQVQRALRKERSNNLDSEWTFDMASALIYFYPKCVVCNGEDKVAIDHVYPLSKGYGLKPGNATRLCVHHNSFKNNKMPEELPEDMRDIVLSSARDFELYWNILSGVEAM